MLNDVTLLINSYNRPGNLVKICDRFQDFCRIEIINNNSLYRIPKNFYGAKIHNNKENKYCVDRWYRAINCETEFVCLLDDDILLDKKTLLKLRSTLILNPFSLIGISGITESGEKIWCKDMEVEVVVGSCSIIGQRPLRKIFQRYLVPMNRPRHGDDIIISLALNKQFNSKNYIISADIETLPGNNSNFSTDEERSITRRKFEELFT